MITRFSAKYYAIILLSLILLLGIFLRTYKLANDPAGFFCDEASIGYNAYSILHTGKDEYGVSFPFFFKAFGEYKNPVEIYSTVPFIALFGLHEWSTRIPSAIYGTLGLVAIYLLTGILYKKSKYKKLYGLSAALLLAISPWDIQFSRVALEGLMAYVFFAILGTYFFLRKEEKTRYLFLSASMFLLGLYSYFPGRIFIPLYVFLLFLLEYKFFWQKKILFCAIVSIFLIGSLPLFSAVLDKTGLARFQQVSIFNQPPANESVLQHIAFNYYTNLSPDFLFFKGDIGMPGEFISRHSIKGMGELYLWQLPFIVLSFIFLIIKRQWKIMSVLIAWILLYPTGNMLTTDESAEATRAIIGVVPWQILTTIGIFYLIDFSKLKIIKIFLILSFVSVILFSFLQYTQQYFLVYPTYSADYWGWQYGFRQTVSLFTSQHNTYDDLLITHRFNHGEELLKFYNVTFQCPNCAVMHNPIIIDTTRNQLFALRQEDIDQAKQLYPTLRFVPKTTILQPNNIPVLFIGTFTNN